MTKNTVEIFASDNVEDEDYIAVDGTRPGCAACGSTESKALDALIKARKAWDAANKRKATAGAST